MDEKLKELLDECVTDDKLRELLMNDKPLNSTEKKPFFDGYKPNFYFKNKPEPVRLYIPRQNGYSATKKITKEMLDTIKSPMEIALDKQVEFMNHYLEVACALVKDISITRKLSDKGDGNIAIINSIEYIKRDDHRDFPKVFIDEDFGGRKNG